MFKDNCEITSPTKVKPKYLPCISLSNWIPQSSLLDVITLKRQEAHDSNDDDDDDSSVYDEDCDLGELSESTEEESSSSSEEDVATFKPPSKPTRAVQYSESRIYHYAMIHPCLHTIIEVAPPVPQKRTKARHRLFELPKDENGNYKMPVKIGNMVIVSLGKIIPNGAYYNTRYIFPVGYTCRR